MLHLYIVSRMDQAHFINYLDLLSRRIAGGPVPLGSDCTRQPEAGLCSLTALEVAIGRWPSLLRRSHLGSQQAVARLTRLDPRAGRIYSSLFLV
jgi:hypothetical protein